jgi:haloalkane dehalogenase
MKKKMNFLNSKLWIIGLSIATIMACKSEKEVTPEVPVTPVIVSDTVFNSPTYGYILRTPKNRFDSLKDYNFKENYVFVEDDKSLRMHYLDEGDRNGKIILLMHGNPAWVYNFRKIIPLLTSQGYRVIAPDLIGFGKSDKPINRSAHTYDNQVRWVEKFITQLNLTNINAHVQDWGGLIGLRVAIRNQSRFTKIAISNTTLPDGTNVTPAFRVWLKTSQTVATYGSVIEGSTFRELSVEEEKGYDAPFPDEKFKAGPRELPSKVPIDPTETEALENKNYMIQYQSWNIPILVLFSEIDNISKGEDAQWKRMPGAQGQAHATIKDASHYIREDQPQEMATRLKAFFN